MPNFCSKCGTQLRENIGFCSKCGSKVRNKIEKIEHKPQKEDTQKKAHVCEYCDKGFSSEIECLRHEKNCPKKGKVEEVKTFKCAYCDEEFSSELNCLKHRKKCPEKEKEDEKHEDPHQCAYCGKKFSDRVTWLRHEKICSGDDVINKEKSQTSFWKIFKIISIMGIIIVVLLVVNMLVSHGRYTNSGPTCRTYTDHIKYDCDKSNCQCTEWTIFKINCLECDCTRTECW